MILVLLAPACFVPGASAAETNAAPPLFDRKAGPYAVEILRYDWFDASRNRTVPVKIYYPGGAAGPFPVIVFSHGLGGSREGYAYLGRHWAGCGYVSVHVQHLGSDSAVWEDAPLGDVLQNLRRSGANLANVTNRPLDVRFAIDQLVILNQTNSPLKQRLDLDRIGVAGHSFGAFTTLAIAGETFVARNGMPVTMSDPRVKAAIPMSSPVPFIKARLDEAFGSIRIPCLHMTGTRDASPIGETTPQERRLPFDHSNHADRFLITFKDGDQMIFSGRARMRGGEKDAAFQKLICIASTAFWDGYLKGDASAKAWFEGGGLQGVLGEMGTFEMKLSRKY